MHRRMLDGCVAPIDFSLDSHGAESIKDKLLLTVVVIDQIIYPPSLAQVTAFMPVICDVVLMF